MRNVPGEPLLRALTKPIDCLMWDGSVDQIPIDFQWDGSSVPWIFQGFFPRHRHPIASCRHDWRCSHAKNAADRLWADNQFRIDVGTTSWKITAWFGYVGVRIGAFLGIGNNF
jgi:hypothetical protein